MSQVAAEKLAATSEESADDTTNESGTKNATEDLEGDGDFDNGDEDDGSGERHCATETGKARREKKK